MVTVVLVGWVGTQRSQRLFMCTSTVLMAAMIGGNKRRLR